MSPHACPPSGHEGEDARLRRMAREMLEAWDIGVRALHVVARGERNVLFGLRTKYQRYALRIHVASSRGAACIAAEVAWLRALGRETSVRVPEPVASKNGSWVIRRLCQHSGTPIYAVLFRWLDGDDVGLQINRDICFQLGIAVRALHDHGATFSPSAAAFPTVMDTHRRRLRVLETCYPDDAVFKEARQRVARAHDRLARYPMQPVHYDLHFHNLRLHDKKLAILDFDDAVLGWPAVDLGTILWDARGCDQSGLLGLEQAFWEGLGRTPSELGVTDDDIESLVAGRMLELLGYFDQDPLELGSAKVEKARARLRQYLEHGRFEMRIR